MGNILGIIPPPISYVNRLSSVSTGPIISQNRLNSKIYPQIRKTINKEVENSHLLRWVKDTNRDKLICWDKGSLPKKYSQFNFSSIALGITITTNSRYYSMLSMDSCILFTKMFLNPDFTISII